MDEDSIAQITEGWRRERPDLPTRAVAVTSLIWRLARELTAKRAAILKSVEVDQATLELLANLRRTGTPYELTPGTLAHRCGVTAAAISLRIRRAEQEGWVVRFRQASDGRSVIVRLTSTGVTAAENYAAAVLRHDDELIAALGDSELADLERLLRRFESAIN